MRGTLGLLGFAVVQPRREVVHLWAGWSKNRLECSSSTGGRFMDRPSAHIRVTR